ncbi:MAG: hypothetical protein ABI693_22395 [Bryobacteraceae bacterium]
MKTAKDEDAQGRPIAECRACRKSPSHPKTKMDSNNYQAHLLLGKAYQRMGREDDAKRQFDMSRALLNDKQAAVESLFEMQR